MAKQGTAPGLPRIHAIREAKVVVDVEWAALHGGPTKRRNEAVTRNPPRFPRDCSFVLPVGEFAILHPQIATARPAHGGSRALPRVFTEHGAVWCAVVERLRPLPDAPAGDEAKKPKIGFHRANR